MFRFERWVRALFLQRRHLLPQSEVFNHEVGSSPTHRPQRTDAESDEKDEYAKHGGGVLTFFARELKRCEKGVSP